MGSETPAARRSHQTERVEATDRSDDSSAGRRRRRFKIAALAVTMLVVAYLSPMAIGAYLVARGWKIQSKDGRSFRISIDDARLGWFSPVRIRGLVVVDPDGQILLTAPRIASRQSLAAVAAHSRSGTQVAIDEPVLRICGNGSILSELLEAVSTGTSTDEEFSGGAAIERGRIEIVGDHGEEIAHIDQIQATLAYDSRADRGLALDWKSVLVLGERQAPIAAEVSWSSSNGGLSLLTGAGTGAIRISALPLHELSERFADYVPGLTIQEGDISGELLVESQQQEPRNLRIHGRLLATDVRASVTRKSGKTDAFRWPEEQVTFLVDATTPHDSAGLLVEEVKINSTPVTFRGTGTITDLHGECTVRIEGHIDYDLTPVLDLLSEEVRPHVEVQDLRTDRFRVEGPLAKTVDGHLRWDLSRLRYETNVAWDSADILGIQSQKANLVARISDGVLTIDPQNLPVNGGRFHARPEIQWADLPIRVTTEAGPVFSDVEFSEPMCRLWLKYLSPVFADATRTTGRFSMSLASLSYPVGDIAAGHASGVLSIESAELRPGPFAASIVDVVEAVRSLVSGKQPGGVGQRPIVRLEKQQAGFTVDDGRVWHDRLTIQIAGTAVHTSGSIGLDESLDLLLEIPLPDNWFRSEILSSSLGGEVLAIPVRGTLTKPQFGMEAVRELTRKLALRATGGLLQKLLD